MLHTVVYTVCMRVNISIDDTLINDFDSYCDKFRYTRSELLSKLMRDVVYSVCKPTVVVAPTVNMPEMGTMAENTEDGTTPTKYGWCQLHFEKGKEYVLREVTWEDENGEKRIDKKLACPKCIAKLEASVGNVIYG